MAKIAAQLETSAGTCHQDRARFALLIVSKSRSDSSEQWTVLGVAVVPRDSVGCTTRSSGTLLPLCRFTGQQREVAGTDIETFHMVGEGNQSLTFAHASLAPPEGSGFAEKPVGRHFEILATTRRYCKFPASTFSRSRPGQA